MRNNQEVGQGVRQKFGQVKFEQGNDSIESHSALTRVAWRRRQVFALLMIERLWPRIMPLILLACVLSSCAWFGFFMLLPLWLHAVVLLGFAVAAALAIIPFRHLRLPQDGEIDQHIERATGLNFQPLVAQFDMPVHGDAMGQALWQAHRQRMRVLLQDLKTGWPKAQIPKRDPHGLRSLVFLSFAIAFAYSFSPNAGRLNEAFAFSSSPVLSHPIRIDAWVNPPEYTGTPPLYLNVDLAGKGAGGGQEYRALPHGSVAHFRIVNGGESVTLWQINETGSRSAIAMQEGASQEDIRDHQLLLTHDMQVQLVTPSGEKEWHFTVIADMPPRIDWASAPRRALNGTLELPYQLEDDYGVVKGWALIKPLASATKDGLDPLYDPPQIALALPRALKGEATTRHDFTNHPWAGIEAEIVLYAQDGAGNIATSRPMIVTLPQRVFGNPLARAVVEQRRLLVQTRANRDLVADMLAALLVRPGDTIRNAAHIIALQSAWTRLSYAQGDEDLRQMVDYLWQIALGIEDDGLKNAADRLARAQQALREALRNGASAQEIERLMQELRQAMQDYIAALAQQNAQEPFSADAGERQFMQQGELEQRLQQLQEMAELGNRAAAEELLNELENLLNNLQVAQGRNGEGETNRSERSAMQQNMDALADMMRRQQEMMNETDRLTQQWQRGERTDGEYAEMMEGLAGRQEELRREWEELQRGLQQQGMEAGEAMGEAGQEMGQARDMLGQGEGNRATGSQGRALEAMRRAGQNMMQAMRDGEGGEGQSSRSLDPLGRERQSGQMSQESDVKIPGEIDIERARRILDEIRARLQYMTPQLERQYLERLLTFD